MVCECNLVNVDTYIVNVDNYLHKAMALVLVLLCLRTMLKQPFTAHIVLHFILHNCGERIS